MNEFKLPFLVYGKYFEKNRTSDFFDLAYTEDLVVMSKDLRDMLSMPDSRITPFRYVEGQKRISAAFLPFGNEWFFVHVQARREDEGPSKNMMRPFYQIRFTRLEADNLRNIFSTGRYGFVSIFKAGTYATKAPFYLEDYTEIKGVVEAQLLNDKYKEEYFFRLKRDYQLKLILAIVNALFQLFEKERGGNKVQLRILYDEQFNSIELKLFLVDLIQRLVYPKMGWISFAIDYVSSPGGTPPKIQFLSQENAKEVPPPGNITKENIIEIDVSDEKSYLNLVKGSYAEAVKSFIATEVDVDEVRLHEDLLSSELTDLIVKHDVSGFDYFLARRLINPDPYYWLSMNEDDFDELLDELASESILKLYYVLKDIPHFRTLQVIILMARKQMKDTKEAFREILKTYSNKHLLYGVKA